MEDETRCSTATQEDTRPVGGLAVKLRGVPRELLFGLPKEDQAAITLAVGTTVTLIGLIAGQAEVEFRDRAGNFHTLWVDVTMCAAGETLEPLHIIVAAMVAEYDKDESCDYQKINRLIEEAGAIVGKRLGGSDRMRKLAQTYTPDAMWDNG